MLPDHRSRSFGQILYQPCNHGVRLEVTIASSLGCRPRIPTTPVPIISSVRRPPHHSFKASGEFRQAKLTLCVLVEDCSHLPEWQDIPVGLDQGDHGSARSLVRFLWRCEKSKGGGPVNVAPLHTCPRWEAGSAIGNPVGASNVAVTLGTIPSCRAAATSVNSSPSHLWHRCIGGVAWRIGV